MLSSDNPTPQAFIDKARSLGLQTALTLGFPTMGRASDAEGGVSKLVLLDPIGLWRDDAPVTPHKAASCA